MFRKPFTAGFYEGIEWLGLDYKVILVISQILGYATSKFVGITYISGMEPQQRAKKFISLILFSWIALVGFALTPVPYNLFWMFLNGLPLGLIWGIVFQYIEGRRFTEILTVLLCVNFIVSSGVAKTLGTFVMQLGIEPFFMPAICGFVFIPVACFAVWALTCIPGPDANDVKYRKERITMNAMMRKETIRKYGTIIFFITVCYILLTIVRDIRDNYIVEIWKDLGFSNNSAIYTTTELPIAFGVLLCLGSLFIIKNNTRAFYLNLLLIGAGFLILLVSTFLFQLHIISSLTLLVSSGIGLFVPYILFNGILLDRFYGSFNIAGNVGFIMYIADSSGYLASVAIMIIKLFNNIEVSWLSFYTKICWAVSIIGIFTLLFLTLSVYFKQLQEKKQGLLNRSSYETI
ncbi:MAG: hypothetical protein IPM34_03265 [Saprospiraceae bacterium]|nr:hypothetical protein [Saprospiraceae bacterium]